MNWEKKKIESGGFCLSVYLSVCFYAYVCMFEDIENFQNNDCTMGCFHVIWIENDANNISGVCSICGNYAQLRALAEKQLVVYNVFK